MATMLTTAWHKGINMFFSKWFKPKQIKKIAFLDGDNPLPPILEVHAKYLKGIETHLVRAVRDGDNQPRTLKKADPSINMIYLRGYSAGKEITDKFIGAYIQKAIQDGYEEITVVSQDYDFVDIFKMAVVLNPMAAKLSFRIIVPNIVQHGRLGVMPDNVCNISIIREDVSAQCSV
jgi:hypothetical protein